MEPFRAFVTDKLPESQVNRGFIMQSLMIGLGGSIASSLPWIMNNIFARTNTAEVGVIADNVKWSFYVGAFFFVSAVLYTVFTTKEYPPTDEDLNKAKSSGKGIANGFREISHALANMPVQMKRIAIVQFFTWPGLFLMWFYYSTAVAVNVFGGVNNEDPVFAEGRDFAGLTLAFLNVVTFAFAFVLPFIADKLGRRITHSLCLFIGALGLISVGWVENQYLLYVSMAGVGVAWTSILSMPYAMLSGSLPRHKVGIYMGIFNFFIVLPEIIASLGFKHIMRDVLHNDRLMAIQVGGGLFILAGLACLFFVRDNRLPDPVLETKIEIDEKRSI
jgi:maltose/moltooligosaccharide transporter